MAGEQNEEETVSEKVLHAASGYKSTFAYRIFVTLVSAYVAFIGTKMLHSNDELRDSIASFRLDYAISLGETKGKVNELGERVNAISARVTMNDAQIGAINSRIIDLLKTQQR